MMASRPIAADCRAGRCICGFCGTHGFNWPPSPKEDRAQGAHVEGAGDVSTKFDTRTDTRTGQAGTRRAS